MPATVDALRRAANRLTATDANVAAVVLFGSLADGTATSRSDADLLVVLHADDRRMIDRVPLYLEAFDGVGPAVQLLPWTKDELAARLREGDPFARQGLAQGACLAGSIEA